MWYLDILEYSLYDCAAIRIEALSKLVSLDEGELYDLIESKLTPLRERLEAEFHQSEEYRTHQEHRRIIEASQEARSAFWKQYEVDGGEYDRCYDVFGQLKNETYLKQIVQQHKAAQNARRSYQRASYSNYSRGSTGRYGGEHIVGNGVLKSAGGLVVSLHGKEIKDGFWNKPWKFILFGI